MILTCHQPNFMPWQPYFEKMQQADLFVVLEHVQFARRQYQNRFQYLDKWMTMPVESGSQQDLIVEKVYLTPQESWKSIKRQLAKKELSMFDDLITSSLSKTNTDIIRRIREVLDITTPLVLDKPTDEMNRSQKIVDLCNEYGAKKYLSGPSGRKYLEMDLFSLHGIEVVFQETQSNSSIIDRLNK